VDGADAFCAFARRALDEEDFFFGGIVVGYSGGERDRKFRSEGRTQIR
jgi:hypothetical protein